MDDQSGEVAARFEVWVYQGQRSVESVIGALAEIDGVSVTSEPTERRDAITAVVADVETEPVEDVVDQSGKKVECAGPSRAFGGPLQYWPGYEVPGVDREGGTGPEGLGACRLFRVWAVDVQGMTLLVLWTTDDTSRFGELVGVADRFFDSMTFGAS